MNTSYKNILEMDTIATILNKQLEQKKLKNPSFSMRSWAKRIGFTSPGSLSLILGAKRVLPTQYISNLSKDLNFTKNEELYFRRLQETEVLKRDKKEAKAPDSSSNFKENSIASTEAKSIFKAPLTFIIKTCINDKKILKSKSLNYSSLRDLLQSDISDEQINNFLNSLNQNAHFLNINQKIRNIIDKENLSVQKVHNFFIDLAKRRISTSKIDEKEYNNYTLTINPNDIPKAKKRIREFHSEMTKEFNIQDPNASVFVLGSYLYKVTND